MLIDRSPLTPSVARPLTLVERSNLAKTIGARLKEARELCGMTQVEAAARLGYSDSTNLSRIESGTNGDKPAPLWLIIRAAQLYEVSTDFILCVAEDWERSEEAEIGRSMGQWIIGEWERLRQRDLCALAAVRSDVKALVDSHREMVSAATEVDAALTCFRKRNDDFDDRPAGSKLEWAVERLQKICYRQAAMLRRFRQFKGVAHVQAAD